MEEIVIRTIAFFILSCRPAKTLEKFGKKLLMDVIRMRASTDLTKSEQIKLLNYIEQEKIYNGVFVEDKGSLVLLKSMLTGLPREQCLNDFGLYQEGNHIKNVETNTN